MTVNVLILVLIASASVHAASHHSSRERESDGAFSPKDAHHHDKDGKHDSKFDHEAFIGSQKEARENEHMKPEESKKKLAMLFQRVDRNIDTFIDKTELRQWIVRSLRMLSKEDSDESFDDNDLNKDGFVDWSEHKEAEYDEDLEESSNSRNLDSDALDDLAMLYEDKVLFTAADRNKDGKLDKSEFFSFSHPEDDLEIMKSAILKNIKETKDKNKDGKIDFQDFIGERGKDHDKEWLLSEKQRFDSELDKNMDGALDDPEILGWIVPDNDDVANTEVDHLFASADDNHDDKLSESEVLDHHDVFIGSEATDYGEHLNNLDRFDDEL